MIKFSQLSIKKIVSGDKVATSRLPYDSGKWQVGEVHAFADIYNWPHGFVKIISIEAIDMIDITDEQLALERFDSRYDYFSEIARVYPKLVITWKTKIDFIVFELTELNDRGKDCLPNEKPEEPEDE